MRKVHCILHRDDVTPALRYSNSSSVTPKHLEEWDHVFSLFINLKSVVSAEPQNFFQTWGLHAITQSEEQIFQWRLQRRCSSAAVCSTTKSKNEWSLWGVGGKEIAIYLDLEKELI